MKSERRSTDDASARDEVASGPTYTAPDDPQRKGHPMSHQDSGKDATYRTDQRDAAQDDTQGLGGNWTGKTAPEQEFREHPPTRGGDPPVDANDAF